MCYICGMEKNRFIIVKESELREMVRQILNEMAMNRTDYIQRVLALLPQITQNWCLCTYAKEHLDIPNYARLLEHWATELTAHLENLQSIVLKSGNKTRATRYALIEAEDLDSKLSNIILKLKHKLPKEGISDQRVIADLAQRFQKKLPALSMLISGTEWSVSDYIDREFFS